MKWLINLLLLALSLFCSANSGLSADVSRKPNVVFVFADQWRAQATGFAGDPNVHTPTLDKLASSSVRFTTAVSTCPVCSPFRGSLMTGQYPLTHGVFLNDVCLNDNAVSLAQAFSHAGYRTAYVGKWHLDGHGRSNYIPRERRHGFEYWRVQECTHDYNRSFYFGDEAERRQWEGYDAFAQTREAQRYIREHVSKEKKPFLLMLSWGPPHDPYNTAPDRYTAMYNPEKLQERPNVPMENQESVRKRQAGYYAHCSALDDCLDELWKTLRETGIEDDTIFVFTSDHGDMLGSHGRFKKQVPYDEAVLVTFLVHWPKLFKTSRTVSVPFSSPDIMPTLLGLAGVDIPKTVEGLDFSGYLRGSPAPGDGAALIACYAPFGEWPRARGGQEYRGIRTERYTYVRSLEGAWLLFDNKRDPYQMKNLIGDPEYASLERELNVLLQEKLRGTHDDFKPAENYIGKWKYKVDATGTVPFAP